MAFGAGVLSVENIDQYAEDLISIGRAISDDGDLRLWSCQTGQGARGSAFVAALSRTTGVDVAAATDLVGATVLGGHWALATEYSSISTCPPLTADGIASYAGVMNTITFDLGVTTFNYTVGTPTVIAPSATFTDQGGNKFAGSTLVVSLPAGPPADTLDSLGISNVGGITTDGSGNVLYNSTIIGTVAGGTGGTPLTITLNDNQTSGPSNTWPSIQALIDAINFTGSVNSPTTETNFGITFTFTQQGNNNGSATASASAVEHEGPVLGGTFAQTVSEGGSVTLGTTDAVSDSDDALGNVTITGLPTDLSQASFSGGTYTAASGTWSGTAAQFNALHFTAGETTGTFNLSIAATTTGAEAATTTHAYVLTVNPVPEGPVLGGTFAQTVSEGGSVTLGTTDAVSDNDDALGNVTITGLPTDLSQASFSGGTYTAASGTWSGTAAQFNALHFTAGETTGTFNLSIAATTTGAEAATTTHAYVLTVNPVPEGPVLGGTFAQTVSEGGSVTLGTTDAVSDNDDALGNVTITGLPTDLSQASFSGGTYTAASGTWSGTAAQFNALHFTAGETTGTFNLSIAATTTGAEAATTTHAYVLTVNPVPEGPVLGGTFAQTVSEGGSVTLGTTDAVSDNDDALGNVTITGLPTDLSQASFSGGTYTAASGTWSGTAAQFNALHFTAGETTGTFNLSIAATTTGAEAATTTHNYALTVNAGAEPPTLDVDLGTPNSQSTVTLSGSENSSISIPISAAGDNDDVLSIAVSGVPVGAILSDGHGNSFTGDGVSSVNITGWTLSGLTIAPKLEFEGTFQLSVTAANTTLGEQAQTVGTINVTVNPVADVPVVTASAATINEDGSSALTIGLNQRRRPVRERRRFRRADRDAVEWRHAARHRCHRPGRRRLHPDRDLRGQSQRPDHHAGERVRGHRARRSFGRRP
ncbi:hypothetical protein V1289_000474 [Bradyrhizobium sp. AZCC 2289]